MIFPVAGPVKFSPEFRPGTHNGTDIFAQAGTDVLAVESGQTEARNDPKGGLVLYLRTPSMTYYYAHLQAYRGNFPRAVAAGEVVGQVGTTGNAQGTSPHLHFEIRPIGSEPQDPYGWLTAAQSQSQNYNTSGAPSKSGTVFAVLAILGTAAAIFVGTLRAPRRSRRYS